MDVNHKMRKTSQREEFYDARKALKSVFGRGSAPDPLGELTDPTGGAHVAPQDFLVGWGGGNPLPIPHSFDDFGVSA